VLGGDYRLSKESRIEGGRWGEVRSEAKWLRGKGSAAQSAREDFGVVGYLSHGWRILWRLLRPTWLVVWAWGLAAFGSFERSGKKQNQQRSVGASCKVYGD